MFGRSSICSPVTKEGIQEIEEVWKSGDLGRLDRMNKPSEETGLVGIASLSIYAYSMEAWEIEEMLNQADLT